MKVFYLKNSEWEEDFFRYDLLCNIGIPMEFVLFNANEIMNLLQDKSCIGNCIFIVNHVIKFDIMKKIVDLAKPCILFHLSDEHGTRKEWLTLAKTVPCIFRQYNHIKYDNSYSNIYQIPLGYVKHFLNQRSSLDIPLKLISQRNISASFVGEVKSDRQQMCDLFENLENSLIKNVRNRWDISSLPVSPKELFDIYSDSIFVLIGRGNVSLDCFRIYEAVVCGALPVIVGSTKEIYDVFYYNGLHPPFLFFSSWEKAFDECKLLLRNKRKLNEKQSDIKQWWITVMSKLRNKIKNILMLSCKK